MSEPTRWTVATDALARHQATEYPTHCDACSLRWPCDTYELAASHETLLAAAEAAERALYTLSNHPLTHTVAPARVALRAAIRTAYGEQP